MVAYSTSDFFVDSLAQITQARIDFLKETCGLPYMWARYLGEVTGEEVGLLAENGIRAAFIARRSSRVCLGFSEGRNDAAEDHAHLTELVRKQTAIYFPTVFLDIEQDPIATPEYLQGFASIWGYAGTFNAGVYLPAVTGNHGREQWHALDLAVGAGAKIVGAWVAQYPFQNQKQLDSGSSKYRSAQWNTHMENPASRVPVIAWQYLGNADGKQFDYSIFSPTYARE